MAEKITHGMVLQQPWARLVSEGVFPAIVRSMPTKIRGQVAIIARGYDSLALIDGQPPNMRDFPQPGVIGSIEIVGCERASLRSVKSDLKKRFGKEFADFYPRHYLPKKQRAYFWILKKPKKSKRIQKVDPGKTRRVWIRL